MKNITKFRKNTTTIFLLIVMVISSTLMINGDGGSTSNISDLNTAIQNATSGDTLVLDSNFNGDDYTINTNKDLTIDGNGAKWAGTLQNTASSHIVLKNIIFDGKLDKPSKNINIQQSSGSTTMNNVLFIDIDSRAMVVNSNQNAPVTINDSKFQSVGGNSIWLGAYSDVTINNTTFKGNGGNTGYGYEGGAISSKQFRGSLKVNNTLFDSNFNGLQSSDAFGGGGGAMTFNQLYGQVTITNSYFLNNRTIDDATSTNRGKADGGAIYIMNMRQGAGFNVTGTTFEGNVAYDDGGAILIQTDGNGGDTINDINISNSTFVNNKAYGVDNALYSGGAIQVYSNVGYTGATLYTTLNLTGNTFVGNSTGGLEQTSATPRGASISASSGGGAKSQVVFNLKNNIFAGNYIVEKGETYFTKTGAANLNISKSFAIQLLTNGSDLGIEPTEEDRMDILGTVNPVVTANQSNIKAGKEGLIIPTVAIKPDGLADVDDAGTFTGTDQRGYARSNNKGAIEMSWVKFDANQGEFSPQALTEYNGSDYYTLVDDKTDSYFKVGKSSGQINIPTTAQLNPGRDGFTLIGWDTDETATTPTYGLSGKINLVNDKAILYAIWEADAVYYTVTYEDGFGGIYFADQTFTAEGGSVIPKFDQEQINRPGYMLVGFTPEVQNLVTDNIVYVARWEEIDIAESGFTITYKDGAEGSVFPDQVYEREEHDLTPEFVGNLVREGYTFVGWDTPIDEFVTMNVTYTAVWKKDGEPVVIEFSVIYKDGIDGQVFADDIHTVQKGNATPQFKGSTERLGFTFIGWDKEVTETVTQNVVYTAQWKMNEISVNDLFTVIFDSNGGSAVSSITNIEGGSLISLPKNPTREGYIFKGWFTDNNFKPNWNFDKDTVESNMTLYAQWDKQPTSVLPSTGVSNSKLFIGSGAIIAGAMIIAIRELKKRLNN